MKMSDSFNRYEDMGQRLEKYSPARWHKLGLKIPVAALFRLGVDPAWKETGSPMESGRALPQAESRRLPWKS